MAVEGHAQWSASCYRSRTIGSAISARSIVNIIAGANHFVFGQANRLRGRAISLGDSLKGTWSVPHKQTSDCLQFRSRLTFYGTFICLKLCKYETNTGLHHTATGNPPYHPRTPIDIGPSLDREASPWLCRSLVPVLLFQRASRGGSPVTSPGTAKPSGISSAGTPDSGPQFDQPESGACCDGGGADRVDMPSPTGARRVGAGRRAAQSDYRLRSEISEHKAPYRTQVRGIEASAIRPGNTANGHKSGDRDRGRIRAPGGTGGLSLCTGGHSGPEVSGPSMDVPREGPSTGQDIGERRCVLCRSPRILIRPCLDHLSEAVSSRPCSVRPLVPLRTLEAVPKRAPIISFARARRPGRHPSRVAQELTTTS